MVRPVGWLRGARRMCVLAAAVASVAGCVGMPSNGPVEHFSASPQSSAPDADIIGVVPSAPQPGENPSQIVQGFLTASASYPTYNVAQDYLVSSAVKGWKPSFAVTVFSQLNVPGWVLTGKTGRNGGAQALVAVSGPVQATFNGSGQYVSASQDQSQGSWNFYLAKVNGQWRITDPPSYRMLPSSAFSLFYKAQDLYFFDPPQDQVLVPDSVFVPLGATVTQLLGNLVGALTQDPKTTWLANATDTELPAGTRVQGVSTDGSSVTVNLTGDVARASPEQLQLFSVQLVWTLTGTPTSALRSVQSVVLELDGRPWTPPPSSCAGSPSPSPQQTQAAYQCYDPYPSSTASFYYIDGGQLWARCGSESLGKEGLIGLVMPVVGRTGSFAGQGCDTSAYVHEGSAVPPSTQPPSLPAVAMAAVSPGGKYLAIVTAGKGDLYVGSLSGPVAPFLDKPRLTGGGITSLSWDRNGNLWVAQKGSIEMLSATGKGYVPVGFNGHVFDLSVAPDGVRIAVTDQVTAGLATGVYVAAIGGGAQITGQQGTHLTITSYASIGPGLTDPSSLTWYDADDLIVLSGNTLYEVPVDGQPPQALQVQPQDVTSITADGDANVLVAGQSGNDLSVSTSLEGPWSPLGEPGQTPAYPG